MRVPERGGLTLAAMPTSPFIPTSQWTDRRHLRGIRGELAALAYLVSCGWEIEAHRFRLGRHDVDLVARRESLVAFIEVKTRKSAECGAPAEAVSARKRAILARVAACWQTRFGRPNDVYRFDLVSVWEPAPGGALIDHVADAWRM
jgi:putative endonuclease